MHTRCKLALVCLSIAGLAACGQPDAAGTAPSSPRTTESVEPAAATSAPQFGREYPFPGGVDVTVSQPTRFTPSAAAYPRAKSALKVDITVHNGDTKPFDASQLSVEATTSGAQAKQVVDATQGVSGMAVSDPQLGAGQDLQLTVGFAAPPGKTPISVDVKPSSEESAVATFTGAG